MRRGSNVGILGIEFATRRRNRANGRIFERDKRLSVAVTQAFGNCPQYIHEREWRHVPRSFGAVRRGSALDDAMADLIKLSDTFFIGSGMGDASTDRREGLDASHRAGEPGFVRVIDGNTIEFPDYAGNQYFNTIGNLLIDPRCGLLFIDFERGGMLQLTGRVSIDWSPDAADDPGARRMVRVAVEDAVLRPGVLSLRWSRSGGGRRELRLAEKVQESVDVTSFHFEPVESDPLEPFVAGQHLPIEVQLPETGATLARTYSLSSAPQDVGSYRISVKREDEGLVSRFLHDELEEGDTVIARRPSGDFVIGCDTCPVLLLSAGIGVTPMLSMLHALSTERPARKVWFVHTARDAQHAALLGEARALADTMTKAHFLSHVSKHSEGEALPAIHDAIGTIDAGVIAALELPEDTHVFLCGPPPFIKAMRDTLEAGGIAQDQIHYEDFGPTG